MKTMFKILVILVVAVLVGGLFYGVVTATSSGTGQSSLTEGSANEQFTTDSQFSPHDQEDVGGIQFPADAVKNLAIISMVSVIYLNATRWLGRKRSTANVIS
jgi:hypothetical protein